MHTALEDTFLAWTHGAKCQCAGANARTACAEIHTAYGCSGRLQIASSVYQCPNGQGIQKHTTPDKEESACPSGKCADKASDREQTVDEKKCRVGEASNPGPVTLEHYFSKIVSAKLEVVDGRGFERSAENAPRAVVQWCVDYKYSVRKIPADGDCLYRALGHSNSMGTTPTVCRQHIAENATNCWKELMVHDPEHKELPSFIKETLEAGKWGGAQQIHVFAHI